MVGLAYGQDSTVTQVVERFAVQMNAALDEIVSFQVQIDSLKNRINLLETNLFFSDTSSHTMAEIDEAVDAILRRNIK